MYTAPKVTQALLLNLHADTVVRVNESHGFEYPISGDALTLLTGPAHTTVNIWALVSC